MTNLTSIERILRDQGPSRSSDIVHVLMKELGISPQAARQQLTRARGNDICRNFGLLPKREVFFYLRSQWNQEQYWTQLQRDLRASNSIYGIAMDGLLARGGIVPIDEFHIVSGAPLRLKNQVSSEWVAKRLVQLGAMRREEVEDVGSCYVANPQITDYFADPNTTDFRALRIIEKLGLEGLREWVAKNSIGAYTKATIRGEDYPTQVGSFKWDLTAPSYLAPLKRHSISDVESRTLPGFVVADSFVTQKLDSMHIQYFIHKTRLYDKTANSGKLLPILMAREFSQPALNRGRQEGVMMATPKNLFGSRVAKSLENLLGVLTDVSTIIEDKQGLYVMIDALSEIEGRSGNMRGILFELIVAHIIQHAFSAKDLGFRVAHTQKASGQKTEIDILVRVGTNSVRLIECKGKNPGGELSKSEVDSWLQKIPIMRDYLDTRSDLRNCRRIYELWTSGRFSPNAVTKLQSEKAQRTKQPIDFKDGGEVCELASNSGLKEIVRALNEHFLNHPLARFVYDGTESWKKRTGLLQPTDRQHRLIADLKSQLIEVQSKSMIVVDIPSLSHGANRAQASEYIRALTDLLDHAAPRAQDCPHPAVQEAPQNEDSTKPTSVPTHSIDSGKRHDIPY